MKKHLMTGLVMLLPLCLTLWIIGVLVNWLTGPFIGLAEDLLLAAGLQETSILFITPDNVLLHLSQGLVIICLVVVTFIIGTIGRYFFFHSFFRMCDALLHRIPLIGSVYKTTKDFISAFPSTDNGAFKQVVLVPFPNDTCYTIGFVTRKESAASHLVPVYIPATPNPTHGYVLIYHRSHIIPIDMKVEEALSCIISCGALLSSVSIKASTVITEESVV